MKEIKRLHFDFTTGEMPEGLPTLQFSRPSQFLPVTLEYIETCAWFNSFIEDEK
jgi:hypothetical protein